MIVLEVKERLRVLSQSELQLMLLQFVLRLEGIDPESVDANSTIVFRTIEGKLCASVFIESVAPKVVAGAPLSKA